MPTTEGWRSNKVVVDFVLKMPVNVGRVIFGLARGEYEFGARDENFGVFFIVVRGEHGNQELVLLLNGPSTGATEGCLSPLEPKTRARPPCLTLAPLCIAGPLAPSRAGGCRPTTPGSP